MKNIEFNKIKYKFVMLYVFAYNIIFCSQSIYANPIQESVIYTGTVAMINDLSLTIMKLSVPLGVAVLGYCFLRRNGADENKVQKWEDRMKISIVSTLGALGGSVIVNLVISYYV